MRIRLVKDDLTIEERRDLVRHRAHGRPTLLPSLRTIDGQCRLQLTNRSRETARCVQIEVNGVPLENHPVLLRGEPVPNVVTPQGIISYPVDLSVIDGPSFQIAVRWAGIRKKPMEYRTVLTVDEARYMRGATRDAAIDIAGVRRVP